jgi:hypothetical protein
VQTADGVLLVVCCESSHSGRYIERVVCGVVISMSSLGMAMRACVYRWLLGRQQRGWSGLWKGPGGGNPFRQRLPALSACTPACRRHFSDTYSPRHGAASHPYTTCSCRLFVTCTPHHKHPSLPHTTPLQQQWIRSRR